MTEWNTGTWIRSALETPDKPIDLDEYFEFWESLSPDEQAYYRCVDLLG